MLDHTLPAIALLPSYHSLLLSQCKESRTLFPSRYIDDLIRQEHTLLYNLKLFVLQVVGMEPGPAWTKKLRKINTFFISHKNRNLKKNIFVKKISEFFFLSLNKKIFSIFNFSWSRLPQQNKKKKWKIFIVTR